MNRRQDLLDAALEAFSWDGFDGTPVSAIVGRAGLSKAAFTYHFATKDSLLIELASPLLDALDAIADTPVPDFPDGVRTLLGRYFDALAAQRRVAIWIDSDKSVLTHTVVGTRLAANNEKMRHLIAGSSRRDEQVAAAAVLGAIWRPVRNLTDVDITAHRSRILAAAMAAAGTARPVTGSPGPVGRRSETTKPQVTGL